jgi:hypothetical protein
MNQKRMLIFLVTTLALAGVVITVYPFFQSLKPSERVDAALPRINISKMENGTYEIIPHPVQREIHRGTDRSILVLKTNRGEVRAWTIPTKNNSVLMPDMRWWQPIYECRSFGPTVRDGKVIESEPIRCHDKETPEWWGEQWQWHFTGTNIKGQVADLEPAKAVVEHGDLVVGKR